MGGGKDSVEDWFTFLLRVYARGGQREPATLRDGPRLLEVGQVNERS